MYSYSGFGLNIVSEIQFPELFPASSAEADVTITYGPVIFPRTGLLWSGNDYTFELHEQICYLEIKGQASFMAGFGRLIVVDLITPVDPRLIRTVILGTLFAGILYQQGRLPLHASAVRYGEGIALVAGRSGAGKSSALAGLCKRGYRLFSDDVVTLNNDGSAAASYPMMKLWAETQHALGASRFGGQEFELREGMGKYGVFFHDTFDPGRYPVNKVVILREAAGASEIRYQRLLSSEAFLRLSAHVYRPAFVHFKTSRVLVLTVITQIADASELYEVTRPPGCNIDELSACIDALIGGRMGNGER
jgi:hypothetical protein